MLNVCWFDKPLALVSPKKLQHKFLIFISGDWPSKLFIYPYLACIFGKKIILEYMYVQLGC